MDACGDVVDTSDVEEKEIIEATKEGYYERVWGKNKRIPKTDIQPKQPTPLTTPLHSVFSASPLSCLSQNTVEDLISYSQDFSGNSPTSKIPEEFIIPEPISVNEPTDSQDPLCLFSFPSSPLNTTLRSKTPLTPLEITSPFKLPVDKSKSPQQAVRPDVDDTPIVIPPDSDLDPPFRKYSLRHRSAKQLNPFEYDSRQYKRQFRHMPEAIVRRTLLQNSHREHDDDWVESQNVDQEEPEEPEEESQEAAMLKDERRQRLEHRREIDRFLKELHITVPPLLSDDSDLENERKERTDKGSAQQPRGKKRKRTIKPFPLRIRETNKPPELHGTPTHSPHHSPCQSPSCSPHKPTSPPYEPPKLPYKSHSPPYKPPEPPYKPPEPPYKSPSPLYQSPNHSRYQSLNHLSFQSPSRSPYISPSHSPYISPNRSPYQSPSRSPYQSPRRSPPFQHFQSPYNDPRPTSLPIPDAWQDHFSKDASSTLFSDRNSSDKEAPSRRGRRLRRGPRSNDSDIILLDESPTEMTLVQPKAIPKKPPQRKRHKRARPDKYQNVYVIRRNGVNVTSGRTRPFIQVDLNDEEFHAALAPEKSHHKPKKPEVHQTLITSHLIQKFLKKSHTERDEFDTGGHGPSVKKISLDLGIQPIPAGLILSREGYIGKGRLFELVAFLTAPTPAVENPSMFTFPIFPDPHKTIADMSMDLTSIFDKLYNASTTFLDPANVSSTNIEMQQLSYALRQLVTYKVLHADEDEANHTVAFISEQAKHLMARIDEKLELVSADGHSLDFRSLGLYWLIVELHLRIAYARRQRSQAGPSHLLNTHAAEEYAIQLIRRLLEYDPNRIMEPLQKDGLMFDKTSPDMFVLEYWVCLLHTSVFILPSVVESGRSFWRLLELGLELQSNKPDSSLAQSERIWKTVFTVNTFSQFSMEGISKSLVKVDAHWPIVVKALQSIRLNADPQGDNAKPATVLRMRDAYLRLVTARCYSLSSRWQWITNDIEDVFRELHSIFRSREFGNLLGEPDDFPSFIRDRDEALCHNDSITDTAYAVFLKLVIRAIKNFNGDERSRATKITRLLSLIVPVGATSFSKASPPLHNDLSKLYNRYTAIYVAIYVDSSEKQIRSRLQQVRRYVNFKTADLDSRMAAIRAMMSISILLRHLHKPLDDILQWASEMIGDLLVEYGESQARSQLAESDAGRVVLLVQTILGTIRLVMDTPSLDPSAPRMDEYPDITYLQVWMQQVLSSLLARDHRIGLEICSCIQAFLDARAKVLPLPATPRPRLEESEDSQEYYGVYDLDMDDPTLLALFDQSQPVNQNHAIDVRASEVLNIFSSNMYSCVCTHLGCQYREIDAWLESWLGIGKILVQNRKKEWDYYIKLAESAWRDIKDPFQRMYIRLRCMLTILKLDPSLYKMRASEFLGLGLEALVSPRKTLEHEYYSLLLCVDGLSHPLLRHMSCPVDPISGLFSVDKKAFLDKQLEFINKVFQNATTHLMISPATDVLELMVVMLNVLYQWKEERTLHEAPQLKVEYAKFVEDILALARSHDVLYDRLKPRLPKLFS